MKTKLTLTNDDGVVLGGVEMETKLILTNDGVVVNVGLESKMIKDEDFYSRGSKVFKHIDIGNVNKMFPTLELVIENKRDEMVTLESMYDDKSKLTQVHPGQSMNFNYDFT